MQMPLVYLCFVHLKNSIIDTTKIDIGESLVYGLK